MIESLRQAPGPDRKLDFAIATFVGFERRVAPQDDPTDTGVKIVYVRPPSEEPVKVPDFTRSIDAAYALAQVAAPRHVGAVTWEGAKFRAKLNDGEVCEAATPAIAVCIAALTELAKNQRA